MPISTFLNDRPVTRLRGLQWLALSDLGQVGTLTSTDDSGGGATQTWTFGPNIPCRVDPVQRISPEIVIGERATDPATHIITFLAGTQVTHSDRVTVTGHGLFEVSSTEERTGALTRRVRAVQL